MLPVLLALPTPLVPLCLCLSQPRRVVEELLGEELGALADLRGTGLQRA